MRTTPHRREWRGNPLRRRSDRVETWVGLVLVAGAAVGAPAVGWGVGDAVHTSLLHTAQQERAERHRVAAVLLEDAPGVSSPADPETADSGVNAPPVLVRWTGRDGVERTARVQVGAGLVAGDTTAVWVDRGGRVALPPLSRAQAEAYGIVAGIGGAGAAGGLLLTLRWAVHLRFERQRLDAWEQEWRRVGPDWGKRPT
ncbi:hypothetical protein ACFV1B_03255 [Streptomyces sp. NPDC059637]|uniref:Rv1733c family protein n=1 Tax=Streptomyces sp. NPDC059637 TaxID=3347752 RepID=UPI00369FA1C8